MKAGWEKIDFFLFGRKKRTYAEMMVMDGTDDGSLVENGGDI